MNGDESSSFFYSPICCPLVSLLMVSPRASSYSHRGLPRRLTRHGPGPEPGDERASVDGALLRPFACTPFLTTLESNPRDLWPPVNGNSTPGIAFSIGRNVLGSNPCVIDYHRETIRSAINGDQVGKKIAVEVACNQTSRICANAKECRGCGTYHG